MSKPVSSSPPWAQTAKFAAAKEALKFVVSDMNIGLGTGTTANIFIELLAEHARKNNLHLRCTATSTASEELAKSKGLEVVPLGSLSSIDLAVDGADQVDSRRRLIKGYGGAHTREKIVEYSARRLVIISDMGKKSKRLNKVVPLEFLPLAQANVERALLALGAKSAVLVQKPDNSTFVTDNGFHLLLVDFGEMKNPKKLEEQMNAIPGVLENGLFAKRPADVVIFGQKDGSAKTLGI